MIPCPNPILLYAYIDGQGSSFSISLMHFDTIKQQWILPGCGWKPWQHIPRQMLEGKGGQY